MMEPCIHETSCVEKGAIIGEGMRICPFSHVQSGSHIGRNCTLRQSVNISGRLQIGDGCKIQNNVSFYDGVVLEDYVFCGPSCVFMNDLTPWAKYSKGSAGWKQKIVREGASIGANATVVCGNTIGSSAMVAAGSVVTKDVSAHTVVMGVPAEQRGWVCECRSVLEMSSGGGLLDVWATVSSRPRRAGADR